MPLEPSDRVRLIRDITNRLEAEEWHFIDFTLSQFSAPIRDDWQGTKSAYILNMLSFAEDEVIIKLARHVDLDFDISQPAVQPNFWRKGYFRLFVSHLAKYKAEAAEYQEKLLRNGVSCFVAHNDIEPTREWLDEIESALATADAMLALMREDFHRSNWTDQEIGYAMGRGLLIIPVRLGQDPYGFIGRYQGLNGLYRSVQDVVWDIFRILQKHKQTAKRMSEAMVSMIESCPSFAEAKRLAPYIRSAQYWDASLSKRCLEAIESNHQVKDAFGVPAQIRRLVAEKGL